MVGWRAAPSRRRSAASLSPIGLLCPIACGLRLFRDARRLDGSEELAAETSADSLGDAPTCPGGTPGRVASPGRFREVNHLPVAEGRCSGFATLAWDLWPLVVALMPRCSLRGRRVVDVVFPPVAFGMRCNCRPARQNTKRPFRNRSESV